MYFSLSVSADLFEGYTLVLPYPAWKRDEDGGSPELTHAGRLAAFEAYERENGPQVYYLEEEYDEDGEENDDYDPYLWIRAATEPADERWYEISLEEAVDWSERFAPDEYDIVPDLRITEAAIGKAVASFCENPYWKKVYDEAPKRARQHLELTFLESADGDLVAANEEEFEDKLERVAKTLRAADWDYLIGQLRGQGGAAAATIREYEKRRALVQNGSKVRHRGATRR